MKVLDVNVVLAAHRDDHPQFEPARAFLERPVATGERYSVTDMVAGAFVRRATNRRVFVMPSTLEAAFTCLRALGDQPKT
jgi:uncharacterized protein